MTIPLFAKHMGCGWYQLPLFPAEDLFAAKSSGHNNVHTDSNGLTAILAGARKAVEWHTMGGRWVALLMSGYFDDIITEDGGYITQITVHRSRERPMVRINAVMAGRSKVAFVTSPSIRTLWREVFQTVTDRRLQWKEDRYTTGF